MNDKELFTHLIETTEYTDDNIWNIILAKSKIKLFKFFLDKTEIKWEKNGSENPLWYIN